MKTCNGYKLLIFFAKSSKLLTIFAKRSIVDVWWGSKYRSGLEHVKTLTCKYLSLSSKFVILSTAVTSESTSTSSQRKRFGKSKYSRKSCTKIWCFCHCAQNLWNYVQRSSNLNCTKIEPLHRCFQGFLAELQ